MREPNEPGSLLVASISSASEQRSSSQGGGLPILDWFIHKQEPQFSRSSTSLTEVRPINSVICRQAPEFCAASSTPSTSGPDGSSAADYTLRSRMGAMGRRNQSALALFSMPSPLEALLGSSEAARILPSSIFALMAVAQRNFAQQFERTGRQMLQRLKRHRGEGDQDEGRPQSRAAVRQANRLLEQALVYERELDPMRAAEVFEELVKLDPQNPEVLARWSKQLSDATYMNNQSLAKIVELNQRAIEVATLSTQLQPNYPLGLVARCVSRGRLAVFSADNKLKVQLAKDASDDAKLALQVDPGNDLAHHLMGRWHYEMAGINVVVRTLIKFVFGTALMQGSYHEAVRFYSQAAELAPRRLVHRVELGRSLVKVGDKQRAISELEASLGMEVEDLNAHLTRSEAQKMLQELRASGHGHLWFSTSATASASSGSSTTSSAVQPQGQKGAKQQGREEEEGGRKGQQPAAGAGAGAAAAK